MELLQVLFGESEIIVFMIIVVFHMNKLSNLSVRSSAEAKCGILIFELLPVKFLVILKSFF